MGGKKINAWLFLCGFGPFVASLFLQSCASYASYVMGIGDIRTCALILFEVMVWVTYGTWYYRDHVKMKGRDFRSGLSNLKVAPYMFVVLAIGLQYVAELWNIVAEKIFPKAMQIYRDLMETAGMQGEISLAVGVYTVILASVGEELIFRGVTLRAFERAGCSFWVANILQAVLFGIFHYNFIQGVYAFILGMVIGYVVELYGTLYAGIVLHMIFNLIGSYLYKYFPEGESLSEVVLSIFGTVISMMVLLYMKKKVLQKKETEGTELERK